MWLVNSEWETSIFASVSHHAYVIYKSTLLKTVSKNGIKKEQIWKTKGVHGHAWTTGARAFKTCKAHPILRAYILSCKNSLIDLQISSKIGKTKKRLMWIANTMVSTSILVRFWCLLIWWCNNWFIYSRIEKCLINCLH